MRIMLDTNILISLLFFPNQRMNSMMQYIFKNHKLVLSSFVVDELKAVASRKFPNKVKAIDNLLRQISFELVYTPTEIEENLFEIRDRHIHKKSVIFSVAVPTETIFSVVISEL